ncbi:MAG: hypothetical protein R3195_04425 [Gemmatimonadota bacterium]|nr:hypothetical protein [Gemmatimonadota bacterium]
MRARIHSPTGVATTLATVAALAFAAAPVGAQQRDARIPDPGDLWLELSPTLDTWTDQFALGSPIVGDGEREPLFGHFDGPLADRLYPGPQPLIDDLNEDAGALGFDPITEDEFSMGRIDYQRINAQRRELAAGLEFGVFRRIALGFRAPLTKTDLEPAFVFDSTTATVMGALTTFPPSDSYFEDARAAIDQLDALIAGGTLMGQELADAIALRDGTDAFVTALQLRAGGERLVPTGASTAGTQMRARYDGFTAEFDSLGLVLPALTLRDMASAADLQRFLEDAPVSGMVPSRASTGLALAEFEVSARIGIIDQITPRYGPTPETPPPARDSLAADSLRTPGDSLTVEPPVARRRPAIRLRTTAGGLMRIPRFVNGALPMHDPTRFMNLPVSDGQTDVEISLYQDVALGDWFMLRAVGRYGIQMADQLVMRIHDPERPYAYAETESALDRDLGDYAEITLRPSIRFNSAIWIGLEYDFWRIGNTKYTAIPEPPGESGEQPPEPPDASPLELETGGSRHMLGFGIIYDLSEARSRADVLEDRSPVRSPWQFSIGIRWSLAGSGGQTPAPLRYQATFRIPIGVF